MKVATSMDTKAEIRLLMLGMSGAGKSSTGNTIIGSEEFKSSRHGSYYTDHANAMVHGRHVVVVDTPEGFDAKQRYTDIVRETARWMCLSAPGPHAILLIIRSGDLRTEQVQKCAERIMDVFGEDAYR